MISARGRQAALVVALSLLLVCSVFALAVAPVAAQEGENETNDSVDDSDRPVGNNTSSSDESDGDEDDEPTSVVEQVDEDVRVLDYRYNDSEETFYVTLENTGFTGSTVTITETVDSSEDGSGTFGVRRVNVDAGETIEVQVDAERTRGSVGVMITTEKSLDRGEGVYLQDDEGLSIGLFDGAASWIDVRVATGAGIAGSVVTVVLGAWYVVAARDTEIAEVSLDG